MNRSTRAPSGFTLLEVLVASVVLTLGVLLVLQSVTGAMGAAGRIERRSRAQWAAADVLAGVAAGEIAPGASGEEVRLGTDYRWRTETEPAGPGRRRLICEVTWMQAGAERSIRLARLQATRGGAP